jgi:hypothetical protein
MRPSVSRLQLPFVLLGVVFMACGDDPVVGHSPCDDANTACLSLRLKAADMTYTSGYDPGVAGTFHTLSWDVSSREITGFAPGRRLMITVTFEPPVEVRYDHAEHAFFMSAGASPGCLDRYASATPSLVSTGWTNVEITASYQGECVSGATRLVSLAYFAPLAAGDRLSRLELDMTVPETYTDGGSSGEPVLAGDIGLNELYLRARIDGNNEGDPPAWPGHFER